MKKALIETAAWVGVVAALTFGAVLAFKLGYIDQETVMRLALGVTGLWMAWYGNRLPKTLVPIPAGAGQARRVASWSLVLSGLVYAGLWIFAPVPTAAVAGSAAVLAGVAVTFGYCLSLQKKSA
uniref:ammonium transporter n=1 Tax=uncultured Caulobacter sp. TaxID=158749 RepID=UPI0025E6BF47|nr:ammonium transporter [uncultured Caulobacter sp.]